MSAGGATWDTAGTLEPGLNIFDTADATGEDNMEFYTQEAFWKYTPAFHQEVRITLPVYDYYSFLMHTGDSFATRVIYPAEPGFPVRYWLLAGVEYHLVVGNLSVLTDLVYEVTLDEITPLATTPWYDDLRERTDNILTSNTRGLGYGVRTHRSRDAVYGITREIDSPPLDGMDCGWLHALNGDSDVIIWEGFCPFVPAGVVDSSAAVPGPYSDADYDATHGGNAQETLFGAAIHCWDVYINIPPEGVLDSPEPVDHGLPYGRWEIEWEDEKPDLRSVEFAADDLPPLDLGDLSTAVDVGITYRDEHLVPPPTKIVPSGYEPLTGEYSSWPLGVLAPDYTLGNSGVREWALLSEDQNWDEFFAAAEGSDYSRGDWVFGAKMVHTSPDDGPEIERPTFTLFARFGLRSPRYRFVYKGPGTVVRQTPRDDTRGTSSAPRLWPPTKSRRLAGGYPGGSNS